MMKQQTVHLILKTFRLLSVCLLAAGQIMGQSELFKTAIEKIRQYLAISYNQTDRQKNPFTGDRITLHVKVS